MKPLPSRNCLTPRKPNDHHHPIQNKQRGSGYCRLGSAWWAGWDDCVWVNWVISMGCDCILSKQPMSEHLSVRRRSHRIKTTSSHQTQPSLLLSLDHKLNSAVFRQEIAKVDTLLSRNTLYRAPIYTRHSLSRKSALSHKIDFAQKPLTYFLMDHCNNEELVSRLLEERGRWMRSESRSGDVNLIWGFLNSSQSTRLRGREVISRVPHSYEMTDKGRLYENVSNYCQKRGISLTFLPITFHLYREGPVHLLKENVREFIEFFHYVRENTTLNNTWILKPTNMNQGRDIHLFNSFEQFMKLVGAVNIKQNDPLALEKAVQEAVRGNRSLIIQKYIQNPLLLGGHKFDIRMWVLVDHLNNFYVFQQGYLRFTSTPYRLESSSLTNNYVHLTNHALQKHSPTYSSSHSLRPMQVLSNHLNNAHSPNAFLRINQEMKRIIGIALKATLGQLPKKHKHHTFEIFGFDFLIDRELNVRLIEANCNPAITEDSPLLAELIPKMLNDAFKLTIDRIFGTKSSKSYLVSRLSSDNSWEKLGEL